MCFWSQIRETNPDAEPSDVWASLVASSNIWSSVFLFDFVQVKVEDEDEEGSMEEQEEEEEEENLEKTLSVERFGDIISDSTSSSSGRMGRNYTEKDFECKQTLEPKICLDVSPQHLLNSNMFYVINEI